MSNNNSNNNNGQIGLGGYGGSVNGGVSQVQLEKCTNQNIDKEMFKLFGQNNLMYDNGTTVLENEQRLGPGRYELDNMYGCGCTLDEARDLQLSQMGINFSGGKGWIGEQGCLVNNDSALREDLLTNKNYINQLPQRYNAGYFGKGEFDVNTDSIIKSGNLTSFGSKACNVLSGVTIDNYYLPMIPRLSKEVQNTKNIIQEDSSNMFGSPDPWVRGGLPSRDMYKIRDYNKRCNDFKNVNVNNTNTNNANVVN